MKDVFYNDKKRMIMMINMNSVEEVTKKLEELNNANLPHMTVVGLVGSNEEFAGLIKNATNEEIEVINKHLNEYLDDTQIEGGKCIFSEEIPNLRWGLLHGEMVDSNTGLNWTMYHYFKINGVEHKFVRTMQYHPSVYTLN